nr:sodium/proline symporter PutP [Thermomonas sp.]
MTASTPLLITFGIYLLAMLGIGFVAWKRTRDFDDYILGGRSLGGYVTALSAGASDMSGWLLMGLPGALYLSGVSEAWIAIGLVVGAWANWRFVAGPLRVYTERTDNALTLPDYFTTRFAADGKLLRIVAALVILVFFAVYCASGIVAGARLFESVFGLSYAQALWWGAAATIAYTLVGGFLAVSWTDTVQATLMIFALTLTPLVVIIGSGGFGESLGAIQQLDPAKLDWFKGGELGLVGIVSLLAWGLGYCGQPHILARFMAAESLAVIPQARRIGMTWMVLCLLGAMATGFFGIAYFAQHPQQAGAVADNHERVFIALSAALFNPWIAGVLLSAILAAIMSTLSCQLLVCSSALTEDFYRGFVRPRAGERELVWVGRAAVLAVALLAIFIARDPDSRVLGLVSYAWAGFGAAFGPVVVF